MNRLFTMLTTSALVLVGAATPALAHERDCDRNVHGAVNVTYGAPTPAGHYETRYVQQWVEGRYEQRWVEGRCFEKHHGWKRRTVCEPGRYEQAWIPGHYDSVAQQVWVEDSYRSPGQPGSWQFRLSSR